MPVKRFDANPLLTPKNVPPTREDLEVYCTINPGAIRIDDQVLLLVRVGEKPHDIPGAIGTLKYDPVSGQTLTIRYKLDDPELKTVDGRAFFYQDKMLLTSLSHLRVARSKDMIHWEVEPAPAIEPTTEWESFGCEDARITLLEGRYYIAYTAVSHLGISVMLAVTDDFVKYQKLGIIVPTFNKDVCLFPEKIHGRYVARHRPYRTAFNDPCIWTAWSPDLVHWGEHSVLLRPVADTWEGDRVGSGAPPIRTKEGWLEIYHGADVHGQYGLGAMLTELDNPLKIIHKSSRPIMTPEAPYELTGVYSQCVFSNGLVVDDDGIITIFYGAADSVTAAATTTVDEMIAAAKM